jgi:hypothetical protein
MLAGLDVCHRDILGAAIVAITEVHREMPWGRMVFTWVIKIGFIISF